MIQSLILSFVVLILSRQISYVNSDSGPSPGLYNSAGQILNIDYANNAVASSFTTEIAVCNENFAVLLSYSRKPSFDKSVNSHHHSIILGEKSFIRRHRQLSKYIGLTHIGLAPDCVHLSEKLFEESSEYKYVYNSEISGRRLISSIATYIHEHTLFPSSLRPFGVNLCMICYDNTHGPQIYEVDCFGNVQNRQLTCLGPMSKEFKEAFKDSFSSLSSVLDLEHSNSVLMSSADVEEGISPAAVNVTQAPTITSYSSSSSSSSLRQFKKLPISKVIEQVLSVLLSVERDAEAEEEGDNDESKHAVIKSTKNYNNKKISISSSSSSSSSSRVDMNTRKFLTKDLLSRFQKSGDKIEISIVGRQLPFTTIDNDLIEYALATVATATDDIMNGIRRNDTENDIDDGGESCVDFSILDEYIEQLQLINNHEG